MRTLNRPIFVLFHGKDARKVHYLDMCSRSVGLFHNTPSRACHVLLASWGFVNPPDFNIYQAALGKFLKLFSLLKCL